MFIGFVLGAILISGLGLPVWLPLWSATLLALIATLLLPGWLLAGLLFAPMPPPWPERLPLSLLLSLGLFSPVAVLLLMLGASLASLGWLVGGAILILAWFTARQQKRQASPHSRPEPGSDSGSRLLLAAVFVGALLVLLLYSVTATTWSSGDSFSYLLYIRHYLEQPLTTAVTPLPAEANPSVRAMFNGWWLLLALVIRVAGGEALAIYSYTLPPLVMFLSLLAFYSLARTLFRAQNTALVAVLLQLLYYLSSINSHDWIGRGFFDRILEDKFLIWLVLLPLVQLLLVRYLLQGGWPHLIALGLGVVALGLTHPIGVAQIGLSLAGFTLLHLLVNRNRTTLKRAAVLLSPLLPVLLVLWLQRGLLQAGGTAFRYMDGSASQFNLNQTRLWIFSALDNSFMAHPHLISHPLTVLAILLTPLLILWMGRSVAAQFLLANMAVPLLLLYNPVTAPLLGRLITPWMLWRIAWLLPVSLTLAFFGQQSSRWLAGRLAQRRLTHRALLSRMLGLTVFIFLVVGLGRYLVDSWQILQDRRTLTLTEAEWDILAQLPLAVDGDDTILADHDLNSYIPGFTSSAQLLSFRWNESPGSRVVDRFFRSRLVTSALLELLARWQVNYIIVERGQPLASQLAGLSANFTSQYQNESYALYRIQPNAAIGSAIQGNDHLLQGRLSQAETAYRQALTRNPQDPAALFGLALVQQTQGKLKEAEDTLSGLLANQPDHLPARLLLAEVYQQAGQIEAAQAELLQITEIWPYSGVAAEALGDFYLNQDQIEQAVAAYTHAVAQPSGVMAGQYHLSLADLLRRKGMLEKAQAEYQFIIELDSLPKVGLQPGYLTDIRHPHNFRLVRLSHAHTQLAKLQGQTNPTVTEVHYRQATHLLFNNKEAYTRLADIYITNNASDKAFALYHQAAQKDNNAAWPHIELGKAYLKQAAGRGE